MLFLPRKHDISRTPGWIFIKLGTGVHHEEIDEMIRFWARSAQRQRSKVNELGLNMLLLPLLTRNLKNPQVDFHQTWYMGAPPGVDELIRFWARSAQRQRSKVDELGLNMLVSPR